MMKMNVGMNFDFKAESSDQHRLIFIARHFDSWITPAEMDQNYGSFLFCVEKSFCNLATLFLIIISLEHY